MADLTLTRHRRYRIGKYKLVLARCTDASGTTTNSVPSKNTRFFRLYGALAASHTPSQGAQPALRAALNRAGVSVALATTPGDLGLAVTNTTHTDVLMIGR